MILQPNEKESILEVFNIGKKYKNRTVLRNVSLNVKRGEAVGLLGPNGAGKTTCFYCITGLITPDYGDVHINGQDITAADVADALGLEKRSVDGIFTSAIQRKGLGIRTPAEVELSDGTHKAVKFLSLTEAGMAFDPDADAE